ncbi:RcnB family protein [Sphingomonas cavernae]|uniref:RcnB family protein n=1 Tax=Sphingomonas cavernae TaxID=2320861 RepID=A0A418WRJ6_9SPHN|nr:RcnB family protein [Sphingomonas cavernae]RJF93882.1 hypothetical protein D3876_06255 [Sphingomonas cavernae]
MRSFIIAALMAATIMPSAAMAQSQGELRRDRQDIRQEQRERNRAIDRGAPRYEVRDQQRDVRDAKREYREDLRDRNWSRNDWRAWRNDHRALYSRGNWKAPYRYQSFRPGARIKPVHYTQRYWIADPWRYRLPKASGYQRWVRNYDDLMLVDIRRGVVIDVIRNFYW